MSKSETVIVETTKVACDGSGPALGHPRVFLTLQNGSVTCPYCGRLYKLAENAKHAAAH